jgi:hypothetical protein
MSPSLRRLALLIGVTGLASGTYAQTRNAAEARVLVAFVRGTHLALLVGQYDPKRQKWLSNHESFRLPLPPVTFTLFGAKGKLAAVQIADVQKQPTDIPPWTWNDKVTEWDRSQTSLALALSGDWPDTPRRAEAVPLDDPEAVAVVADYLKHRGLDVPQPRMTRALRIDLQGDGKPQLLVCANSDNADAADSSSAMVYALALVRMELHGKLQTLPLREMVYHKPAHEQMDEYQRRFGRLAHYDILALPDIQKNGRFQIAVVDDNRFEGPEIDVFNWAQGRPERVLNAQTFYFGTIL